MILEFHEADMPALTMALGSYAAQMRWNLTCIHARSGDRELAARELCATARLMDALGDIGGDPGDLPDLGPMTDEQRHRCAASGADPYALEALLGRTRVRLMGATRREGGGRDG